jgi:peptidyl-tRNA hydrolase
MKIKVLYRRNLKMTPGKLAAQTGHAVLGLQPVDSYTAIVVLAASDKKFFEKVEELK